MSVKDKFKGINDFDRYNALCKLVEQANEIALDVIKEKFVSKKLKEYREMEEYASKKYHIREGIFDNLIYLTLLKAHEHSDKRLNHLEKELKKNGIK